MNRAQWRLLHGTFGTGVREQIGAKSIVLWGDQSYVWKRALAGWLKQNYGFWGLKGATHAQLVEIDRKLEARIIDKTKGRGTEDEPSHRTQMPG